MPNHAPWPKETSPVYPTSRLSPIVATARMTTREAVFTVRPSTRMASGRATSAVATIHSVRYFDRGRVVFIRISRYARRGGRGVGTAGSGTSARRSTPRRMDDRDGRKERAAHCRHADAEHDDGGHVRLQPDP